MRFSKGVVRFLILISTFTLAVRGYSSSAHEVNPTSSALYQDEKINDLIVMIEYPVNPSDPKPALKLGAGIIFGFGADKLYILTARHVVQLASETNRRVQVKFNWLPEKFFDASVERHADGFLDLAVLKVESLGETKIDLAGLPFERLGDVESLKTKDELYSIGYPSRVGWRRNAAPHVFSSKQNERIFFEALNLPNGNSGGALVNKNSEIVGMTSHDQEGEFWAIDISYIRSRLRDWGYPVALGKSETPFPGPFVTVSGKEDLTCALSEYGKLYCWGVKQEKFRGNVVVGKLFNAEPVLETAAAKFGFRFLTLGTNGRALAIDADSVPYFWGGCAENDKNCSGVPRALGGDLKFLSGGVGRDVACGITPANETLCWKSLSAPVSVGIKLQSISVGDAHICGVTLVGDVYCWGQNGFGQLGNGSRQVAASPVQVSGGLKFKNVGVGKDFSCGLTEQGAIYCWGRNNVGQLGNIPEPKSAKAAKKEPDGQLTPVPVVGGLTFKTLGVGPSHVCGLNQTGEAYCWGENTSGKLGNGSSTNTGQPTPVAGGHRFAAINASEYNTCALTEVGTVECWGAYNANGWKTPSPSSAIVEDFSFGWTPAVIPDNLRAAMRYSVRSLLFESRFEEARAKAAAALKAFPDDEAMRMDYVYLLADRALMAQAIAESQPIIQPKSEIEKVLFLARVYLRGGSFADAAKTIEDFEKISAQASDSEELLLLKASALRGQKNFSAAEATLRTLLQKRPNSVQALYDLSYLLAEQNTRLDDALALANQAIALDSNNKQLLLSSGLIHHLQGDSQEALNDLKQAWASVAHDPFVPELLGDVYLKLGEADTALGHWQIALAEWQRIVPARQDADAVTRIKNKIAAMPQRAR